MRFNVAQLLKTHSGETREQILHESMEALDPEIVPLSTLDGTVQFIRTANGVLVFGTLHCSLELVCSRCLDPFSYPLKFKLEEEFHPTLDIATGANLPRLPEDDDATQVDAHHELDLGEVVRQNILLALPPVPVCRTQCAGLCPQCGKNWNAGPCECTHDEIDPRFEKLKELLDKYN